MKNKSAKILWLSDIHFKAKYKSNEYAKKIIDDFLVRVEDYKNEITHVIFSGDLTFNGDSDSYFVLNSFFIDKLKGILNKDVVVLSVPGNHDVLWEEVKEIYSNDKGQNVNNGQFERNIENLDITELPKKFEKIFAGFNSESNKLKCIYEGKEYKGYKKGDLFGYFYDEKLNYLFILINSAWFSFGEVPEKLIVENAIKNLNYEGIKSTLHQILSFDNKTIVENGNQTYAFNLFKKYLNDIFDIISSFQPFVISVSHHPPSWLHWNEKFSQSIKNEPPVTTLFKLSNLHLVGHEHNSPMYGSIMHGHCLLINSGMFLDNSIENEINASGIIENEKFFPNNWFSILTFSNDKLKHQCFLYKHKENQQFYWKKSKSFLYQYNDNLSISILNENTKQKGLIERDIKEKENKIKDISIKLVDTPFEFNFLKYLRKIDDTNKWVKNLQKNEQVLTYYINDIDSTKIRFFIGTLLEYKGNKDKINEMISHIELFFQYTDIKYSEIYISFVDIYSIENSTVISSNLRDILENFIVEREIAFNTFKHYFFSTLILNHPNLFKVLHDTRITYNLIDINKSMSFS